MKSLKQFLPVITILILVLCLAFINPGKGTRSLIRLPISEADFILKDTFANFISVDKVIKLDTKSDGLVGLIVKAEVTDDRIFVLSQGPGPEINLLAFSLDGKFIRKFGSRGKGPGEVADLSGYFNDIIHKQVYLLDRFNKVVRLDYNGKVLSEFKCPEGAYNMVCLDEQYLAFAALGPNSLYITDLTGKEIRHFPSSKTSIPMVDYFPLVKTGKDFLLKLNLNDTLWLVKPDTLSPVYRIDYGSKSLSPKQYLEIPPGPNGVPIVPEHFMWGSEFKGSTANQFCFFINYSRKKLLAYSNLANQTTYVFEYKKIINDPILGKGFFPIGSFQPDYFIGMNMPAVMDLAKIPAALKSIGPIQADDNPILVFYRFHFKPV